MKVLWKFLKGLCIAVVAIVILAYVFKVDYLFTAVRTIYFNGYKTAFLDDYHYFPTREIPAGKAQPWAIAADYNAVEPTKVLEDTHQALRTIAFLIIKNDSIWHEKYYEGYTADSKTNSFSMAKSVVSAALGKAIQRGEIKSLDDKVIQYLPTLKGPYKDEVTVGDLSSMASGLGWDEGYYSPFSIVTQAYFDKDLRKVMLNLEMKDAP